MFSDISVYSFIGQSFPSFCLPAELVPSVTRLDPWSTEIQTATCLVQMHQSVLTWTLSVHSQSSTLSDGGLAWWPIFLGWTDLNVCSHVSGRKLPLQHRVITDLRIQYNANSNQLRTCSGTLSLQKQA